MDTHELREAFLRFFEERGHRRVAGAPIVPPGDPTLLFTSAGMVQFKPYFIGQSKPPHTRLTSVQKCFRTTDIESVGDTKHLTFFEMLGNFSIGDYFKAEMVPWAWEFVTQVLKLPHERLWASVYLDDDEAYDLWRKVGVPDERIRRYSEDENYWFSGDIGPCGPCSEIYYDFGEQFGCGPACEPSHECRRFLEIWNLVFMSYYCDGEKRTPLPSKNIDTGSGLERVATVLLYESEGWDKSRLASPYDTELFAPIIKRLEELSGKKYGDDEKTDRAIRIVAEHSRAVTFLIGDERTPVRPSNEERGYVVRRMLRRAAYFAKEYLRTSNPILAEVVDEVIATVAPAYPELRKTGGEVIRIVRSEDEQFWSRLIKGQNLLEHNLMRLYEAMRKYLEFGSTRPWRLVEEPPLLNIYGASDFPESIKLEAMEPVIQALGPEPWTASKEQWDIALTAARTLPGRLLFTLWDTYGIPVELTREVAEQHELGADLAGFERELERQRELSRAAARQVAETATIQQTLESDRTLNETEFVGYDTSSLLTGIVGFVVNGKFAESLKDRRRAAIVLAKTPFYPESGGQVGDAGTVQLAGKAAKFLVEDTKYFEGTSLFNKDQGWTLSVPNKLILHHGRLQGGELRAGVSVIAEIDRARRQDAMRNHTATHLLHAALRKVLGSQVHQAGSLVAPDRLRFDFAYRKAVTPKQLAEVERMVNEKIRQDLPVTTRLSTFDEAIADGALAFSGEKYGDKVRVVEVNTAVPRFSAELCGGTHCERTGELNLVVITSESSIGAGMRRIEALSGRGSEEYVRQQLDSLDDLARRVGASRDGIQARIHSLLAEQDSLKRRLQKMERSLAQAPAIEDIVQNAVDVNGISVVMDRLDVPSIDALRYSVDAVRRAMPSGVAVLGTVIDGRAHLIATVSPENVQLGLDARQILDRALSPLGGKGGGRPEMAQGGGKDASKIGEALAIVPDAVREMLSGNGPHCA